MTVTSDTMILLTFWLPLFLFFAQYSLVTTWGILKAYLMLVVVFLVVVFSHFLHSISSILTFFRLIFYSLVCNAMLRSIILFG